MLRTGVDMIEVARIQRAMERHGERFFARFFTPRERAQTGGAATRLAARFAAKEAVAKALGTGIGDICWVDVEVVVGERGRPHLELHDKARILADALGLHEWDISLSHTGEYAIAFVVALGK